MRVLAIDPGYDRMGMAVLEGDSVRPTLITSDCAVPEKGERSDRLAYLESRLREIFIIYTPDICAIEKLFFSVNKKTAIGVAEARGVVLSVAGTLATPVHEFAPSEIKLAVTGNGRADKKAVARMISLLISLPPKKRFDDEIDAIAIGITALSSIRR